VINAIKKINRITALFHALSHYIICWQLLLSATCTSYIAQKQNHFYTICLC